MTMKVKKAVETAVEEVKALSLEERKAEIDEIIRNANKAIIDKDDATYTATRKMLADALVTYNHELRKKEYDKFLQATNPMLAALKQGEVDQIGVKEVKAKDSDVLEKIELKEKKAIVDILEFNEDAGSEHKVFINGQWKYRLENWRVALIAFDSDAIEDKAAAKSMKDIIKSLTEEEEGSAFNFSGTLSKNVLKKTAQIILDNIVVDDEGKPFTFEGKDFEYIRGRAFKASSKKLTGSTSPRFETIVQLFTRAMHRIVTGASYEQETK